MDKYSEYLSFPTIFCGKRRPDNKERKIPVPYTTVCKWELRCQDRLEELQCLCQTYFIT